MILYICYNKRYLWRLISPRDGVRRRQTKRQFEPRSILPLFLFNIGYFYFRPEWPVSRKEGGFWEIIALSWQKPPFITLRPVRDHGDISGSGDKRDPLKFICLNAEILKTRRKSAVEPDETVCELLEMECGGFRVEFYQFWKMLTAFV